MDEMIPRPTDKEISAGIGRDGFLCEELEAYRPTVVALHGAWFDFAHRLNQMALKAWLSHPITDPGKFTDDAEPVSVRLHARAMDSFQGAYLLLQRGMVVEAGTLNRSTYEAAVWLGYLAKSPAEAAEAFRTDDLHGHRGRLTAALKREPDKGTQERARAALAEIDVELKGRGKKLDIETVAERADLGAFYPRLRGLSGTAAHASGASLMQYIQIYTDGTGRHVIGPDIDGIPVQMAHCCQALALATDAFIKLNTDPQHKISLRALVTELGSLIGQLPPAARKTRSPPPKRKRDRSN